MYDWGGHLYKCTFEVSGGCKLNLEHIRGGYSIIGCHEISPPPPNTYYDPLGHAESLAFACITI